MIIQTSTKHNSCNISPFSMKFVPEFSGLKDLHKYDNEIKNHEVRFLTSRRTASWKPCVQGSARSSSTSLELQWSLKQEMAREKSWNQLNLKFPLAPSSLWYAWIWHELDKVARDSCSRLHQDQQFTKKNGVYVKNFEVLCERIFGWKLKF